METIYIDNLIKITNNNILFQDYYFPFGSKEIDLSEIKNVVVKEPTLLNGKWRLHGSGDFRTWFPRDWKRPIRDKIFIMSFLNSKKQIGFTVEDSESVLKFFKDKGLLHE